MSYILDALRRADAERERGAVPGINAQPVPAVSSGGGRATGRSLPVAWIAAGTAVVVAGVLAWQLGQRSAGPAPATPVAQAPAPMPAPVPAPASAAIQATGRERPGARPPPDDTAGTGWAWMPGTAPRSRSASARRSASRM